MRWIGHGRRAVISVVGVAVAAGVCAAQVSNAAPQQARSAAACPQLTLHLLSYTSDGKLIRVPTRVLIKRRHQVTCAAARSLITSYVRRATARVCATHGNRCILLMGNGWTCSGFSLGESESAGGAILGCFRSRSVRFTIFPAPARLTEREFYVGTAPGVGCSMSARSLLCENNALHHNQKATLANDSTLDVCLWTGDGTTNACNLGNAGEGTPTYKAGKTIVFGRYRCKIIATGVRCVGTASGKGFEMTAEDVSAIGGATVVQELPQLTQILSSDQQVWCGVIARPPFLTCSTADLQHFGSVDSAGMVNICNDANGCSVAFGTDAPVLAPGERADVLGYTCTAVADGLTCVEPASGHGLVITSAGASALP